MSIFNKNNKKKIALAVACASTLSGKISLAAQNIDKVGGAVVSSHKMGTLTKSLIIGGSILGGTGLIYEILGDTGVINVPTIGKKLIPSLKEKELIQNIKNILKKFKYVDEIKDNSLNDELCKINFTVKNREINRYNMLGNYLKSKNEFDEELSRIQVNSKTDKLTDEGIKALFLFCDIKLISDYLNNNLKFNLKNDSLTFKNESMRVTYTLTMKEKNLEITCTYSGDNPFGNGDAWNYKMLLKP